MSRFRGSVHLVMKVLAMSLMTCLTPTPNHSKLNEVAPAVTGATSRNSLHLTITLDQSVFCASASLLRQTAYFFTIGGPDGGGALLQVNSGGTGLPWNWFVVVKELLLTFKTVLCILHHIK